MSHFKLFAVAVNAKFNELSKHELFTVALDDADELWRIYLQAFPEGSDPIHRIKTQHDCSCCRYFIKQIAHVVAIVNGKIKTLWDIQGLDHPYAEVAKALHAAVLRHPIEKLFRRNQSTYGIKQTQNIDKNYHFYCQIAAHHLVPNVAQVVSHFTTTLNVFQRGLDELTAESFDIVLDLISQKNLYRGEEHLFMIHEFRKHIRAYDQLKTDTQRMLYRLQYWATPAARFKNSVIGTLIQDLSEGMAIESAVQLFESKVAPSNYKRTKSLITTHMVQDAMKTITALGLEPALQRRFAIPRDISAQNTLWFDDHAKNKSRSKLLTTLIRTTSSIESVLLSVAQETSKAKPVVMSIHEWIHRILPHAIGVSIQVKNTHLNHFVSLTAPAKDKAKSKDKDKDNIASLFKWDNDFAWSYEGEVADSIREKVRKAGGNVNAKLRFSLAWSNYDDLDIHCITPKGHHIYYANRQGILDVDMNAGHGTSRTPVENLAFTEPDDGVYTLSVHQFCRREAIDVGFVVEVADANSTKHYQHAATIGSTGTTVEIGRFHVYKGLITKVELGNNRHLQAESLSKKKWGIQTERFVPVHMIMKSPNHWSEPGIGNKHWFFFLKNCVNPEPVRGIYNEFLSSDLEKHRKVFEVLGNKTKCPFSQNQLSGIGFSSTQNERVCVEVQFQHEKRYYEIELS